MGAAGCGPPALWVRVVGDPAAFGAARGELTRRGVLLREDFVHPLYREMTPASVARFRFAGSRAAGRGGSERRAAGSVALAGLGLT
ncbi:hypothetical protein [Deinococcus marmoris]|uniref:hypothetical protein n=1 Tax=Deinococcus marmoris TaxID=249408 RepID=UPI0012DF8A67|nr:hypothetical protein [Deinococcus marmoris]